MLDGRLSSPVGRLLDLCGLSDCDMSRYSIVKTNANVEFRKAYLKSYLLDLQLIKNPMLQRSFRRLGNEVNAFEGLA